MVKQATVTCEYQPYMDLPPGSRGALYNQACSNDRETISAWADTWIKNAQANHAKFGSFAGQGLGKLWGIHRTQPVILVGSGPSLKGNAEVLKTNPGIPVVSCLHNFHYLEDLGVGADYYVTLDAGPITIEEVSEGGTKTADEYWEMTKGKKLIAYISTDPGLLEKWQGEIYFYAAPVPYAPLENALAELESFHTYVSTGGNVLGACTYIAKAIFGCNPLIFIGADFSFAHDTGSENGQRFHGWKSKYDKDIGVCIRATDVYGNSVKTWQSYANFAAWFSWLAQAVPGIYINCTEGGIFGAYPGGNIRAVQQMDLADCFRMFALSDDTRESCVSPSTARKQILF